MEYRALSYFCTVDGVNLAVVEDVERAVEETREKQKS